MGCCGLVLCTTTFNLANGVWSALNVVFLVRVLDLPAGVAALLLGVCSAGGVVAGLFVGRLARLGGRRLVWLSLVCTRPAWLVVPWAEHGWVVAVGVFVPTMGVLVYNVAQVSLRQSVCPDRLMGRMNASIRFLAWGAMPLGALLGGALAEWVGVRGGLWVASVGMVLAVGWGARVAAAGGGRGLGGQSASHHAWSSSPRASRTAGPVRVEVSSSTTTETCPPGTSTVALPTR